MISSIALAGFFVFSVPFPVDVSSSSSPNAFATGTPAVGFPRLAALPPNPKLAFPSSADRVSSVATAAVRALASTDVFARCICSSINRASLTVASSAARTFRLWLCCRIASSRSSGTYVRNHPFGVSSMLAMPARPKYLINSVNDVHFVLFMCVCVLLLMNSLYTTDAETLEFRCETAIKLKNSFRNSSENPSMNRPWFAPNNSICRKCASEVVWHLNPF
mmetsp:Transcript_13013/g.43099  ORF Transcript_13013/g.43099 Transcript_13013/m.43099 type:complete len:220 (-) Transcript_13013:155-814(-)